MSVILCTGKCAHSYPDSLLSAIATSRATTQSTWHTVTRLMLTKILTSWLQRATTIQFGMSQFPHLSKLSNAPRNSFWEALSGICSRTIQHSDSQVNRLCISPDKRFLAAAGHHTVKLYDIKSTNPNPLLAFEGHTGNVTGVAFHCEGKWMVTSSEDGTVKIWETRSGSVQRSYSHGCPVNDVVIHPNQGEIISCDRGGSVRIWDLAENNCSHQLIPEEDVPVASVTVASDGSTLCAGTNTVRP